MLSPEDQGAIRYERLRSVFEQVPVAVIVGMVNACLVAAVVLSASGAWGVVPWLFSLTAIGAGRLLLAGAFARQPGADSAGAWLYAAVGGPMVTGVLWGGTIWITFPASDAVELFLALVIGGMCAGATALSAYWPSAVAFVVPAVLPLAVRFTLQGGVWRVSALMVVIFAAALGVIAHRAHRTFGEQVALRLALGREQAKLRDEAAQRQAAEAALFQSQKMEAIGHLTGGIAHDFNNLLQVVTGNLGLIRRVAVGNSRILGYVDTAERAVTRGADLTSRLLTFARRQAMVPERVNVDALLRQFEPILERLYDVDVRFIFRPSANLPDCLADPAQLQSAVLNLAINARDAMPSGGVLTVTTGVADLHSADLVGNTDARPGRFVWVSVTDTGTGMPPDVLDRVFEPFFTTKEPGRGTGLGLSQIFGFVRQSGGHVALCSAVGEGTTATIWLPVVEL